MSLSQLRSFVAIAHENNLTRAAESLHLSQSAISTQLKGLEETLGVNLFDRSTRGMKLSEEGHILLRYAKEVLAAYASLQHHAETLTRGITASVTIGLNTDPTFLKISAINQRLSLLHPDLNVIFHSSESVNTAQHLKNGSIDLGFFYGSLTDPEISAQLITHVRICVAIPTQFVQSDLSPDWNTLAQLPWIWVDDKFPFYQALSDKFGMAMKSPKKMVTAANEQIVRELVMAGQGIALMREDEARPMIADGLVVDWEHGWSEVPLSIGWLNDNQSQRRIAKARDTIMHVWAPERTEYADSLSDKAWI